MTFPSADVGVEAFPSADTGFGVFPSVDTGVEVFPPMPIPTVFAAVALVMTPDAARAVVPWRDAAVSLTLVPANVVLASVAIEAPAGLVIEPLMSPTEEINAPMIFELSPAAELAAAAVLSSDTGLAMTSGIQGTPVAVVTADAITELAVTAVVAVAGIFNAPAGLTMSPACSPAVSLEVGAAAALTMIPAVEYEVVVFVDSGMTKSGAYPSGTSYTKVTGWAVDPAHPDTLIVDNELIVQGESTNATISASIQLDNTSSFGTRFYYIRLMRSGSVNPVQAFENVSITNSATPTVALSGTGLTLVDGERIWLEVRGNTAEIVVLNNPASYIRMFEP